MRTYMLESVSVPPLDYENGDLAPIPQPAPWKDIAIDTTGCVINGHCILLIAYGILAGFGPYPAGVFCIGGFGLVSGIFVSLLRGIAGGPIGPLATIHFVTLGIQLVGWLLLLLIAAVR